MSTRRETSSRTRTPSTIELEPGEVDFPAVEAGERFAAAERNTPRGFGRLCCVRCDARWSTPVAGDEQDRAPFIRLR